MEDMKLAWLWTIAGNYGTQGQQSDAACNVPNDTYQSGHGRHYSNQFRLS